MDNNSSYIYGDSSEEPTSNSTAIDSFTTEGYIEDSTTTPIRRRIKCTWNSPHPDYPVAFAVWGAFWEFHVYFFGLSFVMIAIQSAICFVLDVASRFTAKSNSPDDPGPKKASPLSISLHALVFSATAARAINLLADPYGTNKVLPCPLGPVFWSCGWPGICCAFSILLMVLLETTRLSLGPPRFQRPAFLAAIIIPSLIFVLVADLMVAYAGMKQALLTCQCLFLVWGLLLCFGFAQVWWKIRQNLSSSSQEPGIQGRENSNRLRKLNMILISCGIVGLCLTLTNLYAITATRTALLRPYFIQAVPWITFQTTQRLLEIVICTLILVSQNRSNRWKNVEVGISSVINTISSTTPNDGDG